MKKNDESFYGYKKCLLGQGAQADPHMGCDGAAVHDRQKLDDVLDVSNTGKEVWADSVYRSAQIEARLTAKGLQSRIHRRAARNPSAFTAPEVGQHDALESARRVQHVFGQQQNSIGGKTRGRGSSSG
jgi:transposase, IS5 family